MIKRFFLLAGCAALLASCSGPGNNPANSAESPDQTGALAPDSGVNPALYAPSADTLRPGDTMLNAEDLSP